MKNFTDRYTNPLMGTKTYFERVLSTRLGRNTMWALGGYGLRRLIEVANFIIIARWLGAGNYGAFIAVTALISTVAPFAGLGSGNLLVKNVARDRKLFAACWGDGLL